MMLQPINSDSKIRQCLDMPYRDGVRYLKRAFDPRDRIATDLSSQSGAKICLTRAVRVLTGIALLIPLLNIIIELALSKLLSRSTSTEVDPQTTQVGNVGAQSTKVDVAEEDQAVEESEAVERTIQAIDDVNDLAQAVVADLKKQYSLTVISEVRSDENSIGLMVIKFNFTTADGRTFTKEENVWLTSNNAFDIGREMIIKHLKFEIFHQLKLKKPAYTVFKELFPGSDKWYPKDLEKDPQLQFLKDGVKRWSDASGCKMEIKNVKVELKEEWYRFAFTVGMWNRNTVDEVSEYLKIDKETGAFSPSKQDFIKNVTMEGFTIPAK